MTSAERATIGTAIEAMGTAQGALSDVSKLIDAEAEADLDWDLYQAISSLGGLMTRLETKLTDP